MPIRPLSQEELDERAVLREEVIGKKKSPLALKEQSPSSSPIKPAEDKKEENQGTFLSAFWKHGLDSLPSSIIGGMANQIVGKGVMGLLGGPMSPTGVIGGTLAGTAAGIGTQMGAQALQDKFVTSPEWKQELAEEQKTSPFGAAFGRITPGFAMATPSLKGFTDLGTALAKSGTRLLGKAPSGAGISALANSAKPLQLTADEVQSLIGLGGPLALQAKPTYDVLTSDTLSPKEKAAELLASAVGMTAQGKAPIGHKAFEAMGNVAGRAAQPIGQRFNKEFTPEIAEGVFPSISRMNAIESKRNLLPIEEAQLKGNEPEKPAEMEGAPIPPTEKQQKLWETYETNVRKIIHEKQHNESLGKSYDDTLKTFELLGDVTTPGKLEQFTPEQQALLREEYKAVGEKLKGKREEELRLKREEDNKKLEEAARKEKENILSAVEKRAEEIGNAEREADLTAQVASQVKQQELDALQTKERENALLNQIKEQEEMNKIAGKAEKEKENILLAAEQNKAAQEKAAEDAIILEAQKKAQDAVLEGKAEKQKQEILSAAEANAKAIQEMATLAKEGGKVKKAATTEDILGAPPSPKNEKKHSPEFSKTLENNLQKWVNQPFNANAKKFIRGAMDAYGIKVRVDPNIYIESPGTKAYWDAANNEIILADKNNLTDLGHELFHFHTSEALTPKILENVHKEIGNTPEYKAWEKQQHLAIEEAGITESRKAELHAQVNVEEFLAGKVGAQFLSKVNPSSKIGEWWKETKAILKYGFRGKKLTDSDAAHLIAMKLRNDLVHGRIGGKPTTPPEEPDPTKPTPPKSPTPTDPSTPPPLPGEKKAAFGFSGSATSPSPEPAERYTFPGLKFMAGVNDKVKMISPEGKKAGEALDKAAAERQILQGQLKDKLDITLKENGVSDKDAQAGYDYLVALDTAYRENRSLFDKLPLSSRVAALEKAAGVSKPSGKAGEGADILRSWYEDIKDRSNAVGIREGEAEKNPSTFLNTIGIPQLKEIIRGTEKGNALREELIQHIMKNGPQVNKAGKPFSLDQKRKMAEDDVQQYFYGIRRNATGTKEFGPLYKRMGFGVPQSLKETNWKAATERYGNRSASTLAWAKHIQNNTDPDIPKFLGVPKEGGGVAPSKVETSFRKEVQDAINSYHGNEINEEVSLNSFAKLVHSSLLGIGSAARDAATTPAFAMTYMDSPKDLIHVLSGIRNVGKEWANSFSFGANRKRNISSMDAASSAADYTVGLMDKLANGISIAQGREHAEQGVRGLLFSIGKEMAKHRLEIGDEKWMKQFDTYDPKLSHEENANRIGKGFVDAVQGSYDARNNPKWAQDGQLAPLFRMARWGIEKSNRLYKDVYTPAKKGEFGPMIRYLLGTALISYPTVSLVTKFLNQKATDDPTFKEALAASDEHKAANLTSALANWAIVSNFGGGLGDGVASLIKWGSSGQQPFGYKWPTIDMIHNNILQRAAYAVEAVKKGEEPGEVFGKMAFDMTKGAIQNVRYAENLLSDKKKDADAERDLRVYKRLEGKTVPWGADIKFNPYLGMKKREFSNADTPEEALKAFGPALSEAIKTGGDPTKIDSGIRDKIMPDPWKNTEDYVKYLNYLGKTKTREEVSNRVKRDQEIRNVNELKRFISP